MSIASYSDLVTAVTEWLARDQDLTLIARIPDFITLCEAKLNRELRHRLMEKRATALVNMANTEPQYISLPLDFQTMRRMRCTSVSGSPTINFFSNVQADEYRTRIGDVAGQPRHFTIIGTELELIPTPDTAYTIEMVYRANLSGLTSTNTTNWLLTIAPDVYLYGTLMEASPYIQKDDRIAVWGAGFTQALSSLNTLASEQSFGSGPLVMRSTSITP
jgi:hypothetical protein